MISLAELKQQPIKDDDDLLIRLAIDVLYSVKEKDEFLRADRQNTIHPKYSISDYGHFWYSHICEGGCFNYALSIYAPEAEDKTWVRIVPAPSLDKHGSWTREEGAKFDIRNPNNDDLKAYIRSVLDVVKKYQDRKPWVSPFDR